MDLQNRFRTLFLNELGSFFQAVEAVFARGFGLENELASVPDKSNYPDPQK